ncbi:nuclear transport factor 2 family protein [Kushneria phyllosphaerae]|uniref:SnoaL-like domain-containing protein n=1 Tax=Kushneria phyllosphaerae TaxID=2100822 RepID=A0A2R8CLH4_9GAMM|nr:nuclear transport factor 2 family protein [Kushneria phyllosphaerae]SPJ33755.1 hypothetical protein KSP9073_01776 [Kushneria phyllosphaerae]
MSLLKSLGVATTVLMLAVPAVSFAQSERDIHQEEANRELVVDFYNRFFNDHDTEKSAEVLAPDYIQHNPGVPDGRAPVVEYFSSYFKAHPDYKSEIMRSAADGDLVWLHVHSTESDKDQGEAVVDIFRVNDGKIVEHWDVIQPVPDKSANDNTMF